MILSSLFPFFPFPSWTLNSKWPSLCGSSVVGWTNLFTRHILANILRSHPRPLRNQNTFIIHTIKWKQLTLFCIIFLEHMKYLSCMIELKTHFVTFLWQLLIPTANWEGWNNTSYLPVCPKMNNSSIVHEDATLFHICTERHGQTERVADPYLAKGWHHRFDWF